MTVARSCEPHHNQHVGAVWPRWAAALLTLTAAVTAADIEPSPAADSEAILVREAMARFIPAGAGFYLRLSHRSKWQGLLPDNPAPQPERVTALPVEGSVLLDQLAQETVVLAARSWRQRLQAVTLCTPRDPQRFGELLAIPEDAGGIQVGWASAHRLTRNLWVATDQRIFALNEIGPELDTFQNTLRLLGGEPIPSLLSDPEFRLQMARPDPEASAVMFFRGRDASAGRQGLPGWLPNWSSMAAAVDLAPGRVQCLCWGQRHEPATPVGSMVHPGQLGIVPASTVAALACRITGESLLELLSRYSSRNRNAFSWQFMWSVINADTQGLLSLVDIGPRGTLCTLASPGAILPRGAVIIESSDPAETARVLAELFQQVAHHMLQLEPQPYRAVQVRVEEHEGHTLYNLDIDWSGEAEGVWSFLHFLKPSFAAVDGNLVAATDPSAIREMIAAARSPGFAVPLLDDWASSAAAGDDAAARGFVDPGRLAVQLDRIEALLTSTDSSIIKWDWFQDLREYFNATPMQLGARLAKDDPEDPGKVKVLSVLEGRPADGKLKPGDFIWAVDGQPLALENTRDDLRRKLEALPAGGPRRLRVERHGRMHEIVIDLPQPSSKSFRGLLTDTGAALEYLDQLGRHVSLITYRQFGSDPAVFKAELTFELSKP